MLRLAEEGQVDDEARHPRVPAVEASEAIGALGVGGRRNAAVVVAEVSGATECVAVGHEDPVLEAAVDLGLHRVVVAAARLPRRHVSGPAERFEQRPSRLILAQHRRGVQVERIQHVDAAVADVGDLSREAARQLTLVGDVPGVQDAAEDVGRHREQAGVAQERLVHRHDAARRDVHGALGREAGRQRPPLREGVGGLLQDIALGRVVEGVRVVGIRGRARAVPGAQHVALGDAPRDARPRVEVPHAGLDAQVCRDVAVAGHAQRVVGRVVGREPALLLDAHERRVVLVAQAEIHGDVRAHLPLVVHEEEVLLVPGAGLVDERHVAAHVVGVVEHERREGVGHVVADCDGIARRRRPRPVVRERAARAAEVLRLQQEVAVATEVGAELHLVVAGQLGQRGRERPGRLAAVPGHRVREAHERVAVVLQIHRHDAARVVADVDAGDAEFLRGVEAVALGGGDVVVPGEAAPRLHHERVGPRPRPVEAGDDGVVGPGTREAAVGRAADVAGVRRRVDHHGPHEAEARRQLVAVAHLPVDLDVELVGLALTYRRGFVVGLTDRLAREVGHRHAAQNIARDGADAIGRQDVVGERRPVVPARVARQRVADDGVGGAAEVAAPPLGWRHEEAPDLAKVVVGALVVAEVEEPITPDRAADDEAELVVVGLRLGLGEVRLGVEAVIAVEPERAPAHVVGPRLERHVGDRAAGAPELRVEVARADGDRLERLGRGNEHGQQPGAMVVVDAFHLHVVAQAALPVHLALERVLRVEELGVRPAGARRARHRRPHALEVAAEAERHRLDGLSLNDAAGVGAVGLQGRRLARHRDRLGEIANLETEVRADGGVDVHLDVLADRLLEAGQLGLDAVHAVAHVRERVVARLVGDGGLCEVGPHLGDGDGDAGNGGARVVRDVPQHAPAGGLGMCTAGHRECQHRGQHTGRQPLQACSLRHHYVTPRIARAGSGPPGWRCLEYRRTAQPEVGQRHAPEV